MAKVAQKSKLSDKLVQVNENFSVYMYDNGYVIEISGRNSSEDWVTSKIIVNSLEELLELITEASKMPRS